MLYIGSFNLMSNNKWEKSMSKYIKYKVKDIQLAEWGRREIQLAEAECPA